MEDSIERQKLAYQNMFYSIQRIDLLIISISGAGIYVCFETIKYLDSLGLDRSNWVKVAGAFFLFGIIVNILSQFTSYKTNEQDYLMCLVQNESKGKRKKDILAQLDFFDKKSNKFSRLTTSLNYMSVGLMFIGLVVLAIYFLFIF